MWLIGVKQIDTKILFLSFLQKFHPLKITAYTASASRQIKEVPAKQFLNNLLNI